MYLQGRVTLVPERDFKLTKLRESLENKLTDLPGIEIHHWKDTDLVCIFFNGKDFAHFHSDTILDIRLSQKIIREEKLPRTINQTNHPNRSKNSRWIEVEFHNEDDVKTMVHLVQRACHETM